MTRTPARARSIGFILPMSLVACLGAPPGPPRTASPAPPAPASHADAVMVDPVLALVDLDARLSIEDQHLRVDYTITNRTDQPIAVCDELVDMDAGVRGEGRRLLVKADEADEADEPGTALLLCGSRLPLLCRLYLPPPAVRRLEPGASFTDWKQVPLPLESWNPAGMMEALPERITKARFAVHFFTGEPRTSRDVLANDGRTLHLAEYDNSHLATTLPMPIPPH